MSDAPCRTLPRVTPQTSHVILCRLDSARRQPCSLTRTTCHLTYACCARWQRTGNSYAPGKAGHRLSPAPHPAAPTAPDGIKQKQTPGLPGDRRPDVAVRCHKRLFGRHRGAIICRPLSAAQSGAERGMNCIQQALLCYACAASSAACSTRMKLPPQNFKMSSSEKPRSSIRWVTCGDSRNDAGVATVSPMPS